MTSSYDAYYICLIARYSLFVSLIDCIKGNASFKMAKTCKILMVSSKRLLLPATPSCFGHPFQNVFFLYFSDWSFWKPKFLNVLLYLRSQKRGAGNSQVLEATTIKRLIYLFGLLFFVL